MIKITKVIVDNKRNLIGFFCKGKQNELEVGGFCKNIVEVPVGISAIMSKRVKLSQIGTTTVKVDGVNKTCLTENNNFKMNEVPMVVYINDNFIPIDNGIAITHRYVYENENTGFRVKFADGSEDNIRYANLINLARVFKPVNFSIRTSSKGNSYICGKNGSTLDSLPFTDITNNKDKNKHIKSSAKEKKAEIDLTPENGYDILDIYDFIRDSKGFIINLPNEEYKPATYDGEKVNNRFINLGIGEVADLKLDFNPTKLNTNAQFKKVGIVPVVVGGDKMNVTTFTYRTKSIFLGGENYIKNLGVAIPKELEAEFLQSLGKSLAIQKIEDTKFITPLSQVLNNKGLVYYRVNTDNIDLISSDKLKESLMKPKQISDLYKKLFEYRLASKMVSRRAGLLKMLKEDYLEKTGESIDIDSKRKPFGIFKFMNEDGLKAVAEAGIDVYTGAFTEPWDTVKSTSSNKKEPTDDGYKEEVSIEYSLEKYNLSKYTAKALFDIVNATYNGDAGYQFFNVLSEKSGWDLPKFELNSKLNEVFAEKDVVKKYKLADKLNYEISNKLEELNKTLWMHNAAMYILGNKQFVHTLEKATSWELLSAKTKTYKCNLKGCENLKVKLSGVDIA